MFKSTITNTGATDTARLEIDYAPTAVALDGIADILGNWASTNTVSVATSPALGDNPYQWQWRIVDALGDATAWFPWPDGDTTLMDFGIDTASPLVQITGPATTLFFSNLSDALITGQATDSAGAANSGISAIQISVQSPNNNWLITATTWGSPGTQTWFSVSTPTPALPVSGATVVDWSHTFTAPDDGDGVYNVSALAFDQAGNASLVASWTVNVDSVAPLVQITGPATTLFFYNLSDAWITGNAVDSGGVLQSGLTAIQISIQSPNGNWLTATSWGATQTWFAVGATSPSLPVSGNTQVNWSHIFNVANNGFGYYTVYVKATDGAGNPSSSVSWQIRVVERNEGLRNIPGCGGSTAISSSGAPQGYSALMLTLVMCLLLAVCLRSLRM